jgi:cytochrome oxidase assembly protein ShyY1
VTLDLLLFVFFAALFLAAHLVTWRVQRRRRRAQLRRACVPLTAAQTARLVHGLRGPAWRR